MWKGWHYFHIWPQIYNGVQNLQISWQVFKFFKFLSYDGEAYDVYTF